MKRLISILFGSAKPKLKLSQLLAGMGFLFIALLIPSSQVQIQRHPVIPVRGLASAFENSAINVPNCSAPLTKIILSDQKEVELLPHPENKNTQAEHFLTYEQTSFRDLTNYISIQGPELETRINALGPEDLWIDIGTGLGLAPLERARLLKAQGQHKLKVLALNKQPFNDQLLEQLQKYINDPNLHYTQLIGLEKGITEATISHIGDGDKFNLVLTYLSRTLGLSRDSLRAPNAVSRGQLNDWLKNLKTTTLELRNMGINFVTGELAENILAQSELPGKLITDMFGAYYYSPDRVRILELAYKNMKPGAAALFTVDDLESTEVVINGQLVPVEKYLTQQFPDIFKSYSYASGFKTLLMIKPESARVLDLGLEFKGVKKPGLKRVACQYGMCGGPQFQMVPDNRVVPHSVYFLKH